MGEEKGSEFYDHHLKRVSRPLAESPWRDLYEAARALLPSPPTGTIVDIGCGTGRLARLLFDHGYLSYWGFDFAEKRVAEARRYVPELEFSSASAFDPPVVERLAGCSIAICLEVLEHIQADRALLANLPSGALVILSVPNYDSAAHVRRFSDAASVQRRYEDLIDFDEARTQSLPRSVAWKRIFLLVGTRRP